ncbi:MAG: response regulator [Candidatus Omnitrophica bacterium]|nr:response regulator [Candidatus Omnitrophota bacterium]MCM8831480.1 response regulator [Candidatus Omnitrophota bacterium]
MQIKILVVDDDLEVLRSLGKVFTTLLKGYLVLSATSANEGLSLLKEQRPDIVIVDVKLGPVSGMDLIRDYKTWLAEHDGSYNPIFIVITAYDDEEAKKRAQEYKVDAFLMKPFSKEAILHAVIDGVCKILHSELSVLDDLRNHYKMMSEKIADIDKKLKG